jgi:hypothetical protein
MTRLLAYRGAELVPLHNADYCLALMPVSRLIALAATAGAV